MCPKLTGIKPNTILLPCSTGVISPLLVMKSKIVEEYTKSFIEDTKFRIAMIVHQPTVFETADNIILTVNVSCLQIAKDVSERK